MALGSLEQIKNPPSPAGWSLVNWSVFNNAEKYDNDPMKWWKILGIFKCKSIIEGGAYFTNNMKGILTQSPWGFDQGQAQKNMCTNWRYVKLMTHTLFF